MQALRATRVLARLVLAWFALVVGVAAAAPLLQSQDLQMVCSGAGMKLVLAGDDEGQAPTSASLDCPLCAAVVPPPSAVHLVQPQPLGRVLQAIPAARIAALTAPSLPARGPPVRFA